MPRVRVGELELAYEVDGAGEPLLLLMGLGGDRHGWDLVRGELARHHRLVLVDHRDAGESDEARAPYGLGDVAADALAVADAAGIARFHVLGASMGAGVALHVALQEPTRVASLVLAGVWGRTDAFLGAVLRGWRLLVERLRAGEFLALQAPWAFSPRVLEAPPPELAAVQETLRARGGIRSVAAYQRQVDACLAHDVLPMLAILRTPALVLAGEDDILTPARYGRAVAAGLARAEVALLPAAAHASFLETPKPFVRHVLRFLAQHPIAA
jgi:pimeloyl-ACP methyl ester carboxylesterase